MEIIIANEPDLQLVPERVQQDLCRGILDDIMQARKSPEYWEAFHKWQAERKRGGAA